MAKFFSTKNSMALIAFWKKNTEKSTESYGKRLLQRGAPEGGSREQTKTIELVFESDCTLMTVTMDNGESKEFRCSVIPLGNNSVVQAVAKELSLLAYGKSNTANSKIAALLHERKPGQNLIIERNNKVRLSALPKAEAADSEEDED
jgi:hypothetical protein